MQRESIRVEKIAVKDLCRFAESLVQASDAFPFAPITCLRALSHTRNPCAKPDDVALLAAYCQNRCIGYHGLFPGLLSHDGTFARVFWTSTFYVADAYRGRGFGKRLVQETIRLNVDILVTRFQPEAEHAYVACGFRHLENLSYHQIRFDRLHSPISLFRRTEAPAPSRKPQKGWGGSAFERFERYLYTSLKKRRYRQLLNRSFGYSGSLQVYPVDRISRQADRSPSDTPSFYRGIDAVNHMLTHKWIISRDEINGHPLPMEMNRYFFSDIRDLHRYQAFEIVDPNTGDCKGFFVLSVSRNRHRTVLKLLDHDLQDTDAARMLLNRLFFSAQEYLADRIEISSAFQEALMAEPLLKPLVKQQRRSYLYYPKDPESPLARVAHEVEFDYCDGETSFT